MNASYRLVCLLVLCGALFASVVQAATLHVLIVGDVNDWGIGRSVRKDVNNIKALVGEIIEATGLDLDQAIFIEENFSQHNVTNWLSNLRVGPDDVVMYYHSGHGYRTLAMEEVWPALSFGWFGGSLRLKEVADAVVAKRPRLALVMADVCNSYIDSHDEDDRAVHLDPRADYLRQEGFRRLFLHSRGHLVASSSKPGQYSVCMHDKGGLFTEAWRAALDDTLEHGSRASWDKLMTATMDKTRSFGRYMGYTRQEPHYELVGSMSLLEE
jgi:hypothetical protein